MVRDAYQLMKHQWFTSWFGFIFNFIFFGLYGALAGLFSNDWLSEFNSGVVFISDVTILTFMSSSGFLFSKVYLNPYWRNDTFTKNLATLRVLPISTKTLAFSRVLQIVIMTPFNTLVFFSTLYACSAWAQSLNFGVYIGFVMFWFAFGIASSSFLVVLEWGTSGKWYLGGTTILIFVLLAACVIYYIFAQSSIAIGLANVIQTSYGWLLPVLTLAIAGVVLHGSYRRLQYIMTHRDVA